MSRLSIDAHARLRVAIGQDIEAATRPVVEELTPESFGGPARMRKTSEVSKLLELLDEIEAGKDGLK